jgi:hypothetical protein
MHKKLHVALGAVVAAAALVPATATAKKPAQKPAHRQWTVFATGLNNPRGLTFGPRCGLYVAEGGLGGSATTTSAQCTQVPAPIGPYSGGRTARISKISRQGVRTTVADGLPSDQTSAASGSLVSGVADVAFVRGRLYALEAGAGCSHGLFGNAMKAGPPGRRSSREEVGPPYRTA